MPLLCNIRARGNPIPYLKTAPWLSLRTLYVGKTRSGLNIDNNRVDHLKPGGLMPPLRNIRARGNPIQYLNTSLCTLYAGITRSIFSPKRNT
ncbi:hypothetical protein M405DRAFT_163256 [Rhizopogon salebrosus TDB-379]|nr:hypothetical protein M405DRAFT_163256 [Rhizopogon salebrosus TDB-379]